MLRTEQARASLARAQIVIVQTSLMFVVPFDHLWQCVNATQRHFKLKSLTSRQVEEFIGHPEKRKEILRQNGWKNDNLRAWWAEYNCHDTPDSRYHLRTVRIGVCESMKRLLLNGKKVYLVSNDVYSIVAAQAAAISTDLGFLAVSTGEMGTGHLDVTSLKSILQLHEVRPHKRSVIVIGETMSAAMACQGCGVGFLYFSTRGKFDPVLEIIANAGQVEQWGQLYLKLPYTTDSSGS